MLSHCYSVSTSLIVTRCLFRIIQRSPSDFVLPLSLEDRYDDQKKVFEAKKDEIKVRLIPDSFESLNISETQKYTPVYNSSTTQLPSK